MAASYPSSAKSFSTKTDGAGQTIFAAHVNDLQDEVVAVENGLVTGLAHDVIPDATNTRSFGSAGKRWLKGWLKDLDLSGNATPAVAATQDLGTTALPWQNGYFTGLPMDIGLAEGRLTLTTAVPVTTADVTGAGTLYWTPFRGNRIALFDGTSWALYTFTEVSLALTLTSGKPYDVWIYNNSGTLTLEVLVWTNDTTRATALTTQNGVYVKTGATTRRYLGTLYASGANTTEDSAAKRYLWNYYNRVDRFGRVVEGTDTWSYNTATYRQAGGNAANQLDGVIGVAEELVDITVIASAQHATSLRINVSIGEDSTTTPTTGVVGQAGQGAVGTIAMLPVQARLLRYPAAGRHTWVWLERGDGGGGTTTWHGDNGDSTLEQNGIFGRWKG